MKKSLKVLRIAMFTLLISLSSLTFIHAAVAVGGGGGASGHITGSRDYYTSIPMFGVHETGSTPTYTYLAPE
jgi:threonine dehydratase